MILESVSDLTTINDTPATDIEHYCFIGAANIIQVVTVFSDAPSKFSLAAIKKLKRAHEGDKNHIYNLQRQYFILEQDLRMLTGGNLFAGIDVKARISIFKVHFRLDTE